MNSKPKLTLTLLDVTLAICRLDSSGPIPEWATAGSFYSVTRTSDELSVVCPEADIPEGIAREAGWRCLKAEGPFAFSLTGILSSLLAPLAEASVSIFAMSTYDTDYLLVKKDELNRAIEVLAHAGHQIKVG